MQQRIMQVLQEETEQLVGFAVAMAELDVVDLAYVMTDLQQMVHGLLKAMFEYFSGGPGEFWSAFLQTVIPGIVRGRRDPHGTVRRASIFFARILVVLDRRLAGEAYREQALDEMMFFVADWLAAMDEAGEKSA